MKYLRKFFLVIMIVLIIIMIVIFTGYHFNTDMKLKKTITIALEEKYGEEFICHDIRNNGGNSYFGICSPINNQDIKFETLFFSGGTIKYDEYYSSCVAEKIEDIVDAQLKDIFEDYYLHSYLTLPLKSYESDDTCAENIRNKLIDIETYVNMANKKSGYAPVIMFYLCVNSSEPSKLSFEEEYDILFNIFTKVDELGINSSIVLKFVPEETYKDCTKYLEKCVYVSDTFHLMVEDYPIHNFNLPSLEPFISFDEDEEKTTLTKKDYISQRK